MKVIEHHTTPDGLLKFIVEDHGDDIAMGFESFSWHTHPECVPPFSEGSWQIVVKAYIEALISDQLVIGLRRVNGRLANAWVADKEPEPDKCCPPEEKVEYRYWSGRKYETTF